MTRIKERSPNKRRQKKWGVRIAVLWYSWPRWGFAGRIAFFLMCISGARSERGEAPFSLKDPKVCVPKLELERNARVHPEGL